MDPIKSSQTALNVDMKSLSARSQAIKKLKSPKFVPFEPTKAAVGPIARKPLTSSPYVSKIPTAADVEEWRSRKCHVQNPLHRYAETVLLPRGKSLPCDLDKTAQKKLNFSTKLVTESAAVTSTSDLRRTDRNRPVNIVDPIRNAKCETTVDIEDTQEYDATQESRAVAHLQAVNEACNNRIIQLREERTELKKELELQFQINAELKKLLVASLGDEMHHDIEMLVRQRTQLSSEIDSYCKQIQDDHESMDKMTIMADVWRTKYIASRVMVDELAAWKAELSVRHDEAKAALQQILLERQFIRQNLADTHGFLQQINATVHQGDVRPCRTKSATVADLSKQTSYLAQTARQRLLGSVSVTVQVVTGEDPTPAERLAQEVLSHADVSGTGHHCHTVSRFHPDTRYELLTLNCCKHCKGDISVV